MIAKWHIVQGTEEWHKERYAKIGGSTSKGLFVDSETLMDSLLAEHLEEYDSDSEDGYSTADMQRGVELEPMARLKLEEYTGFKFLECGWMQSEVCSLLGISPDGISEDLTMSCEIKCPAKKKHTQTIRSKQIPADNIHQCLHYFTVNPKLETHYFVSFRPESKYPLFVKSITRNSVIDLGTKAKPQEKTVSEWVKIALANATLLEQKIKQELLNLESI
jgi:hypothetical protein